MARRLRKTFCRQQGRITRRLIDIDVCGISWKEVFEACLGFLDDEDVPSGYFAAGDLEFLAKLVQKRLYQVNIDASLPCNCDTCKQYKERMKGYRVNTELAKPGDRIIIIDTELSQYSGKEWIVIEEPLCGRAFGPYDPKIVWVGPESGTDWPKPDTRVFLRPHQYQILT